MKRYHAPCCTPVVLARFVNEEVTDVGLRHRGSQCAPTVESIDIKMWRSGVILLNGEEFPNAD
jgi:hypothetical protein